MLFYLVLFVCIFLSIVIFLLFYVNFSFCTYFFLLYSQSFFLFFTLFTLIFHVCINFSFSYFFFKLFFLFMFIFFVVYFFLSVVFFRLYKAQFSNKGASRSILLFAHTLNSKLTTYHHVCLSLTSYVTYQSKQTTNKNLTSKLTQKEFVYRVHTTLT